jgi:hypothetical protein
MRGIDKNVFQFIKSGASKELSVMNHMHLKGTVTEVQKVDDFSFQMPSLAMI